ncbi:hypothetical protein JW977_00130 [Candidatus Falkowbacteria bacterium]|nr:hypothetical protein [Candidatus Falkowbacteria bacterium]
MAKVLWFSRHELSEDQLADLKRIYGQDLTVTQINRTIKSAFELKAEIDEHNVIAVVAPLPLQAEFLKLAGEKPVIFCKNDRVFDEADNTKVNFVHAGWFRIKEIRVDFERL